MMLRKSATTEVTHEVVVQQALAPTGMGRTLAQLKHPRSTILEEPSGKLFEELTLLFQASSLLSHLACTPCGHNVMPRH